MSEITPTLHESVSIINNCDTVTLFDIGLRCNVERIPSTSTSNDGILSIVITGGTSPYTVYWNNIQGPQRLINVGQGSYPVTVVDYYGDYTASTICTLIGPTATPAPTATPTPTPTPITYPNFLCFVYQSSTTTYGPIQFFWNGSTSNVNGKPTWSGTYNGANLSLVWTLQPPRWEINGWNSIPGWNQSQGIPVSTSTSNVPLTNWSIVGGQPATTTMSQGVCPPFVPLRAFVEKQDSTCPNRNNGSITITADAGVKTTGYLYSIDGGQSYSSTNIFNNLPPNTYPVVVKDNANPPNITAVNQVSITNLNQITNYTFSIQLLNQYTTGTGNKTFDWKLDIDPQLKPGMACEIRIYNNTTENTYFPGNGTISSVTTLKKNTTTLTPAFNYISPNGTFPRPNCPYNYNSFVRQTTYFPVLVEHNDVVSGTSVYDLTITNFQTGVSGCSTKLEQIGTLGVSGPSGLNFNTTGFTSCDTITISPVVTITNTLP
jgi:hypothetical protein